MQPDTTQKARWRPARGTLATILAAMALLCCGCPVMPQQTDVDLTSTGAGLPVLDVSGNGSLHTATALSLDSSNELRFEGTIDGATDIDVFELGVLGPGDEVFVDVQTISGNLDPVAAIFDSREYLVAFNDDRKPDASNLNPLIDFVIRGEEDTYFLAIIAWPGDRTTGTYEATVRLRYNVGVPAPSAQIVFLDWRGGDNVVIQNVGVFNLLPFSASDVGLADAQTGALKDRVQGVVEDRFDEYNLIVLNSDDDAEPSIPHSTVYFGGLHRGAFAISEQIDAFNEDPTDNAIIFTESYQGTFRGSPTLEQMAQALGNTIAHEVGHLLGLVHTHDCDSLMDTTCFNERLLSPQEFTTAELDDTVFPFGYQSVNEILEWVLGFVGL